MARLASFKIGNTSFKAAINKIDRDKIYGFVDEFTYDMNGDECTLGAVLNDGSTFVLSGATAMKKVDEKLHEVDKSEIKTVKIDGSEAVLQPSIFDIETVLEETELDALLDLQVELSYQLSFENDSDKATAISILKTEKAYFFLYNYRADYEAADAYLLSNGKEIFALSGKIVKFEYLDNKTIIPIDEFEEETASDEELDFSML
jgi:hypothetical protein